MGIREYGRHRGVSHVAVLKAIRTGRIRQGPEGLIDSDQADRDWARNTHPAPRAPHAMLAATDDGDGYSAARTVREVYLAKLARLEFEQRASELVDANGIKLAAYQTEQVFRQHMLRIPDCVVPQVAGEVDEHRVHEILSTAVRAALTEFADDCAGARSSVAVA